MSKIGILAYGSLIWDPRCEIEDAILRIQCGVLTPFHVEFARSSSTRGGAPTLVPVVKDGAHVEAVILILKEQVSLEEAKNMLWRRETDQVCSGKSYEHCSNPGSDTVCIKELNHFNNIETVIYTSLEPDIANRTPRELAELAIASVCSTKKEKDRDGITYLIKAKHYGIETPKMKKYEEEIKSLTGTESLEDALSAVKNSCP